MTAPCTSWCSGLHHDDACWSADGNSVALSIETPDARVSAFAYRNSVGDREVIKLNMYRPHENKFLDVDAEVHLTAAEARELAAHLLAVAARIEASPA